MMPLFEDEELKRLEMPVLVIVGEKDALLHSRKTAERLSRLLPQATIEVLPDQGHVLIGLQERVLAFLTG
jgi:pimeloyl-ACP methyl ester carboxylesterase